MDMSSFFRKEGDFLFYVDSKGYEVFKKVPNFHVDTGGCIVIDQIPSLQQLSAEKVIDVHFATATLDQIEEYRNSPTEDKTQYGPAWDRVLRRLNFIRIEIIQGYAHESYEKIYQLYCCETRRAHHNRWKEELARLLQLVYYADFFEDAVHFQADMCLDMRRRVQENYCFNPHYYHALYRHACKQHESQFYSNCYLFLNGSQQFPELDSFERIRETCRQDNKIFQEEMKSLCISLTYYFSELSNHGMMLTSACGHTTSYCFPRSWCVPNEGKIRILLLKYVGRKMVILYDSGGMDVSDQRDVYDMSRRIYLSKDERCKARISFTPTENARIAPKIDRFLDLSFNSLPGVDFTQYFIQDDARTSMLAGFR